MNAIITPDVNNEIAELVDKELDKLNAMVEELSNDIDDLVDIIEDSETRLEQKRKEHESLMDKMTAIEMEADKLGII